MATRTNGARQGKVISFEPGGDFFLKRGSQRLERNDLLEALASYRQALRRDPDNAECRLAIAEVLTEMQRYDESNRFLFALLSHEEKPTECYFGMACNFIGLQDYHRAYDSLESYLMIDPEGEYAADAIDILEAMDDEETMRAMPYYRTDEQREAAQRCLRAKHLLEMGNNEQAIELLETTARENPQDLFVQNNLSMGYFCTYRYDDAIQKALKVLETEPDNVQAHCNLALYYNASGDKEKVKEQAAKIQDVRTEEPDDVNRMAVVLLELGYDEAALRFAKQAYSMMPYDPNVIHRLGTCRYRLGQYRQALVCYDRLMKLDEDDTVAKYYRARCYRALKGEKSAGGWINYYQVPYEEMLRRIKHINHILAKPYPELMRMWREDRAFKPLLLWGLNLTDEGAKRALLTLIGSFGDKEAEYALRDFQLLPAQPDTLKREVFGLLKQLRAPEPYLAYLNGELVQSKINIARLPHKYIPVPYQRMLQLLLESVLTRRSQQCVEACMDLYEQFLSAFERLPRITNPQTRAIAAALEYLGCEKCGETTSRQDVMETYGVTSVRLNNALKRVRTALMHTKDE